MEDLFQACCIGLRYSFSLVNLINWHLAVLQGCNYAQITLSKSLINALNVVTCCDIALHFFSEVVGVS